MFFKNLGKRRVVRTNVEVKVAKRKQQRQQERAGKTNIDLNAEEGGGS